MTSWTDYQDDISDAISDSMDADWSASVGAKAVVAWLNEHKPLSAAPAPEGGAVKRACVDFQEAIDDFEADVADVMAEGSERADLWDREITVNIDALKTVMIAALATRHEAPAEAGEIGAEYDDAAHCVTLAACPPGLFLWNGTLGFKSEYGAMEPVGISPHHQQWKVGNRVDAYCADSGEYFWGGTSNHDDRAKLLVYPISAEAVAMVASHGLSALRAHPPAREDAQPVASAYRVRPEMNDPEEWTLMHPERAFDYLDRPGWETQPLYTHPASDALRVAVEGIDADYMTSETHHPGYVLIPIIKFDAIRAALQAEQKGGAA